MDTDIVSVSPDTPWQDNTLLSVYECPTPEQIRAVWKAPPYPLIGLMSGNGCRGSVNPLSGGQSSWSLVRVTVPRGGQPFNVALQFRPKRRAIERLTQLTLPRREFSPMERHEALIYGRTPCRTVKVRHFRLPELPRPLMFVSRL